jgi:hypothetical protein
MHLFFHDTLNVLYSGTIQLLHLNVINIIQLFNGCGCNRLEYFPCGPGNDQKFYCMRPSAKLHKTSYWSSSSVLIVLLHKILENLEIFIINRITKSYILNFKIRPLVTEYALMIKLVDGTSSAHSFNPYAYFSHSWSYFDIQNIYYFFYLYISFQTYKSTSNDTKGFSWKDLPSWKCEILHVIFTTMHKNN